MAKLANLARMTVNGGGTGALTLTGAASSFLTFAAAGVANGDVVSYAIQNGVQREVGRGTYSSTGPTLTRTTVLKSTNGNAAINVVGAAEVVVTALAEDINPTAVVVADRTELATLPADKPIAFLNEGDRWGPFRRTTGSFSLAPTRDVTQGITVPTLSAPLTTAYIRLNPDFLTPGYFGVPKGQPNGDHDAAFKDIRWALEEGWGNKKLLIDRPCRVPDGWVIYADNPTIEGVGDGHLYFDADATYHGIYAWQLSGLRVRGLKITGPAAGTRANTAFGIYPFQCNDVIIEDCVIQHCLASIWVNGSNFVWLINNRSTDTKADGLHFSVGTTDFYAIGNHISNFADDAISCTTYGDSSAGAIRCARGHYLGNTVVGGSSTWGAGLAMYETDDMIAKGNILMNIPGNAIQVSSHADGDPAAPSRNISIEGNRIFNPGTAHIVPGTGEPAPRSVANGILLADAQDIRVTDNFIEYIATSLAEKAGVFVTGGASGIEITGNTFKDINGDSIYASGVVSDLTIGPNQHRYVTGAAVDLKTGGPTLNGRTVIHDQSSSGCATAAPNTIIRVGDVIGAGGKLRIYGNIDTDNRAADVSAVTGDFEAMDNSPTIWRSYNANIRSQTTNWTAATQTARWCLKGGLVEVDLGLTVTDFTGATDAVVFELPFTPVGGADISGVNITTGYDLRARPAGGTSMFLFRFDNQLPITANGTLRIFGSFSRN